MGAFAIIFVMLIPYRQAKGLMLTCYRQRSICGIKNPGNS